MRTVCLALLAGMLLPIVHAGEESLSVFAAGSLRGALTDIAHAFEQKHPGAKVRVTFGPSGVLKDRLVKGEAADIFASANMQHPQALAELGRAQSVRRFAVNALCALVAPRVNISQDTLVEQLLNPSVKLGTSTPKSDPAGDYAWAMFEKIEQQGRPGAFAVLSAKALQLTGGPQSPPPPPDRNVYGVLTTAGQADVFVTYCTNATAAAREFLGLKVLRVPQAIDVQASYGATVLSGARPGATDFMDYLLGPDGQAILANHGFSRL